VIRGPLPRNLARCCLLRQARWRIPIQPSQQALGTSVMGGMIAVVVLALLMVPVFFVTVQRLFAGDREVAEKAAEEPQGMPAPAQPRQ